MKNVITVIILINKEGLIYKNIQKRENNIDNNIDTKQNFFNYKNYFTHNEKLQKLATQFKPFELTEKKAK